MSIRQISVFCENQSGRLADVIGVISELGVDIRALSVADTDDFGVLRLIVNEPEKTADELRKRGIMVAVTEVIAVGFRDEPGALYRVLDLLRGCHIPVEYAYAFISRRQDDAYVILRVEDNQAAIAALRAQNISLLDEFDLYAL